MKQYIATLSHDKGKCKLLVLAENEQHAIELIMKAENCPASAIERIEEALYYKKDGTISHSKYHQ